MQVKSIDRTAENNEENHDIRLSVWSRRESHNVQVIVHSQPRIRSPGGIDHTSQTVADQERDDRSRARSYSRSRAASAQRRDSKERFSKVPVRIDASSARREKSKKRSRSRSASESARLRKRDSKGRFTRSHFTEDDSLTASMEAARGRSREISNTNSRSANSSIRVRDAERRFHSCHRSTVSTQPISSAQDMSNPGETSASRPRSRSLNAILQRRDSNGRFSTAGVTAEVAPKQKETPENKPLDRGRSVKAASSDEMGGFKEKLFKAKKAHSKSPYFATDSSLSTADNSVNPGHEQPVRTPKKRVSPKSPKTPKVNGGEETPKKPRTPRTPGGIVSCIPFPPLSAPYFGLIQEKLAHDPFRLLIAVTFLIRTHGKHAIPVFYQLMEKYPTPESLVAANKDDIVPIIRHLGLQNQRAGTYQTYAKLWLEEPPVKGKRYAVRDYPTKGAGKNIKKDEILTDEDERIAWEIGHMTQGPYAIDSWRIFCRDVLRGMANGWNGEGAEEGFQPEWMRTLPEDKELRTYLRWMWLKEGFEWDPFTGEKEVASERLMRAAMEGKIAWDDMGGMRILDDPNDGDMVSRLKSPTPDEPDQSVR